MSKLQLEPTTLWDYPTQNYGSIQHGIPSFNGVTPAFLCYNLVQRYTRVGDVIVDPMAGGGTMLDVAREEGRLAIGFDLTPVRQDIIQCDATKDLPLPDNYARLIFCDPPYSDNVKYMEHPDAIHKLSAELPDYYEAIEKVVQNCHRILMFGGIIGWLICDQWIQKRFTPTAFLTWEILHKYFIPIDIVAVAYRGASGHKEEWYQRAIQYNFYLRGFRYLLLFYKGNETRPPKSHEWGKYK